jgi:hypothetical protein
VSIVSALLRTLRDPELVTRVLRKFVEADFAKLERLVELHIKWAPPPPPPPLSLPPSFSPSSCEMTRTECGGCGGAVVFFVVIIPLF